MPVGMNVGSVALQPVWTVTVSVGIWQPCEHLVVTVLVLVVGQQLVLKALSVWLSSLVRVKGEAYEQGTLTVVILIYIGHITSVGAGQPASVSLC
jgi:hypothetical protein